MLHHVVESIDSTDTIETPLRYLKPTVRVPDPKGSLSFSIHPQAKTQPNEVKGGYEKH